MTAHPSMWQLCSNPQPTHSQYLGAKGRGNAAIFFSCSISSGDAFSYGLLEQAAASNFRCWGIGIRLPFFVYRQVWVYYNLTAAHRTAKGIMQAVNNGGVADYGSVIVVMESAIVVFSNYSVAIVVVRDEFIAALVCIITWPSLAITVKRAAGRSERQQLFTAQHLQHFIRQHAEIAGGIAPTAVQRQRLARVVSVFDFLCAFADNRAQ